MASGPFHESPAAVPDHFAATTTPLSSSSVSSPSTSTSASASASTTTSVSGGMTSSSSTYAAPTPPPKAAKPHNFHHHHHQQQHQHDNDDKPPVFRLHQHNLPPSYPHSSPSPSPSPSPHPPQSSSSSSTSYTSAARSLKNRAVSKLSSLVPLLREPSKNPLHISTDGVSVGASIITGLLHKLRSAPTQERNAVLCSRDSDISMLSTFSGHGKHGVRLAELSASLVFRHVRRRMMISSSSSSSTGEGGGERGMPEVGYQQEVFSIERIVDDALVAVYRNVGNTRWIRNSNVSATVCVVTNGRLVVGACGLPTVLLVSKSSRNGTVVELLTGRKMMSSAQVKQLEQQQQQQQEEMGCEGDERERERDKEEEGNDDEDDEEQGEKVVEVKQEEDKVKEGESKTNETTRTTGTGTVIVPKRRISRAKRNDDVNVGATNDNGDGDKQSSRIVLKQNSNNKLDIDIDIDIDIDDDDEDNDDDDVVEEISSDLEEEEEEGTCNVTDSDPSSSSSSRSSMTSRSFPRKHGVSMNDKVTRTSTSNKKRSHCPSQSYCQSNNSMGDDTMNQHSNNMLHTILVSSASTRTLTELCSSDDTTRATQLNMSIPQLHGRFSLPSVDNECETDESRRKTSMNNEGMVLGTCATPCIRSFELSCRHTHVIVSTTRLWAGDNEIAPQSISDVFAKAGSQTSVIDLAERVTEVAFGGCVPTHDTTVLCARLRKR